MGAMDARNMYSNLAANKYLQTVASRWISSTQQKIYRWNVSGLQVGVLTL